jgi:hypothetical protein
MRRLKEAHAVSRMVTVSQQDKRIGLVATRVSSTPLGDCTWECILELDYLYQHQSVAASQHQSLLKQLHCQSVLKTSVPPSEI